MFTKLGTVKEETKQAAPALPLDGGSVPNNRTKIS